MPKVSAAPIDRRRAAKERSKQLISFDDVPFSPPRRDDRAGIDITLIFPPLTKREASGGRKFTDKFGHLPPLGLTYLAGALEAKGYEVDAIDPLPMGLSEDDILERIAQKNPRVVGISALTPIFTKSLSMASRVRERFPEKIIILGGVYPTLNFLDVLETHHEFDILCVGEGEVTIVELMNALRSVGYDRRVIATQSNVLSDVLGIVYRENGNGRFTGDRPFIDIDTLPLPARHLLPMERYIPWPFYYRRLPLVHLFVSRGCPWACAFCSTPYTWGSKVRLRSPDKVIEEIKHVIEHFGAREIAFWDDTFTAEPEWLTEVCERIVAERLDIIWRCLARADDMTPALARTMKKGGCWQAAFGLESANQNSLKAIRKGLLVDVAKQGIRVTQEAGIKVRGLLMLGLPHETPELAQKTIDFAISCNLDYAQFSLTTPHKGTDLYTIAERHGTLVEEGLGSSVQYEASFIPDGYRDAREMYDVLKSAYRQFYFRPRFWWQRIRSIRSWSDIVRNIHGFKIALLMINFREENWRSGQSIDESQVSSRSSKQSEKHLLHSDESVHREP